MSAARGSLGRTPALPDHGGTGGFDGDPPDGRPPGRLPEQSPAEIIAKWRRGLREGWKTPGHAWQVLHATLPDLRDVQQALRNIGWPTGDREFP